ncbi:MAG: MBL fold metallo-hydrolase [Acidobacteria bacterium]|nr:MBL fold metallo-hydrolase [Acidobacteriota bacterium]
MRRMVLACMAIGSLATGVVSTQGQATTDIYFIDTDGGQSVLIVSPSKGILGTKETLLLDAGNLNPPGRDAERIVAAMKDAAVEWIDQMVVSHYHGDHVGGVAALADKVPIRRVLDPGAFVPEQNGNREAGYLSYVPIRQNAHVVVAKPGMKIPVAGLEVHVVSSAGDLITAPVPGVRRSANPLCANPQRKTQDPTPNNFESVGVVVEYGRFRYLDLADLTWNQEIELVCPANLLGTFSVYRTTRHGTEWSGAQALVHSARPRVAVMNNNPTKGGVPGTFQVVKSSPGLEDFWQLHFSDNVSKEVNSPEQFIANFTAGDAGHHIKLSARSDGSFTVTNGRNGFAKEYPAQPPVVTSSR